MKVWGDAGRVALARSYILGWFAFCYLQLHGLSVLFSYLMGARRPGAGQLGLRMNGARGGMVTHKRQIFEIHKYLVNTVSI